jgi:hypothetical protein
LFDETAFRNAILGGAVFGAIVGIPKVSDALKNFDDVASKWIEGKIRFATPRGNKITLTEGTSNSASSKGYAAGGEDANGNFQGNRNGGVDLRYNDKFLPDGSVYSVAYETQLPKELYPGGRYDQHFTAANKALQASIDGDPNFARMMNDLGVVVPKSARGRILGTSPRNWVWQHDITPGTMQLVPKIQHTNGSIFWKTLHPNGKGGMSIWNKK